MTLPVLAGAVPAPLRSAARLLFWLTLAYVAFVTLSPIGDRPVTPFGPQAERFSAFLVVSALLMVGYPTHRLRCFWALAAVAALLEAGQNLVGGRHGRVIDFDVKVCGAAAGAAAALVLERLGSVRLSSKRGLTDGP